MQPNYNNGQYHADNHHADNADNADNADHADHADNHHAN